MALASLALAPAAALAADPAPGGTGGATPGSAPADGGGEAGGGATYGDRSLEARERAERRARRRERERAAARRRERERAAARRREQAARPVLAAFSVSPGRLYAYGTPATVRVRIVARAPSVRATLVVRRAGSRAVLRRVPLGGVRTRRAVSIRLGSAALPEGDLELRMTAVDDRGRRLRVGARAAAVRRVSLRGHRFPLIGSFSYGGEGSQFGASRPGHVHQGQDLTAPEGTPVVAPRGGAVKVVAYQAEGAGHYVILDGADEDRDYAFMHLQTGSIAVRQGQRVSTGQLLGRVGSTGASSGPHLHFEIWEGGGWYEGGRPVDPLPYLRRWDGWS